MPVLQMKKNTPFARINFTPFLHVLCKSKEILSPHENYPYFGFNEDSFQLSHYETNYASFELGPTPTYIYYQNLQSVHLPISK